MVVLATPFSQVSGAPVAVPGSRGQSVTGGSGAYLDLKEERHAVIMALLQLNAMPSGMELFPAADEDAWTLIKSVIEDCDYYLLVVGGRYGSIDPVEDISYTEKEYDYAIAARKPVMAFLHADPDSIPVGK